MDEIRWLGRAELNEFLEKAWADEAAGVAHPDRDLISPWFKLIAGKEGSLMDTWFDALENGDSPPATAPGFIHREADLCV